MEGDRFVDKIDMGFSILVTMIAFFSSLIVNKFWDLIYTYQGIAIIAIVVVLVFISVFLFSQMINDNIEGRIVYWTAFWFALIYVLLAVPAAFISGLINHISTLVHIQCNGILSLYRLYCCLICSCISFLNIP